MTRIVLIFQLTTLRYLDKDRTPSYKRSQFMSFDGLRESCGIGRLAGFMILWGTPVGVRFPPFAPYVYYVATSPTFSNIPIILSRDRWRRINGRVLRDRSNYRKRNGGVSTTNAAPGPYSQARGMGQEISPAERDSSERLRIIRSHFALTLLALALGGCSKDSEQNVEGAKSAE